MATMPTQGPLTAELLEQLLSSSSPQAYLSAAPLDGRGLADYARELLEAHGTTRAQVIRAAGLNTTYGYQIFQGERSPRRDQLIMLAFGLGCTLDEAQRLLRYAGHAELWCKQRRDAIVIFCLDRGMSRAECDDELYRLGEPTLLTGE